MFSARFRANLMPSPVLSFRTPYDYDVALLSLEDFQKPLDLLLIAAIKLSFRGAKENQRVGESLGQEHVPRPTDLLSLIDLYTPLGDMH